MSLESNNIDRFFKESLYDYEVQPAAKNWNKIKNGLNGSVQANSNKKSIIKFLNFSNFKIAVAILFGIAIGLSYLFFTKNNNTEQANNKIVSKKETISNNNTQAIESPEIINSNASEFKINSNNIANNTIQSTTNTADPIKLKKTNNSVAQVNLQSVNAHSKLQLPNSENSLKLKTLENVNSDVLTASTNDELEFTSRIPYNMNATDDFNKFNKPTKLTNDLFINQLLLRQLYFVKGFHIGLKAEFNNSWFVAKQLQADLKEYQTRFIIDGGIAYGALLGYDFNHSFGLQTEIHTLTKYIPHYIKIGNNSVKDRIMKITYTNIPVLAKFKKSRLKGIEQNPVIINYIVGLQFGKFTSINNAVNAEDAVKSKIETMNFNQVDVVLGLNYDLYLNEKIFISIGGRTTFGSDLPNSVSNNFAPNNIRNATIGIEAGLHYKLTTKRK